MAYAERIHPPLSRNMLTEKLNRIRPALSRDSLPDMRESVMPALSDRLLNAPEATSAPQHHQAQQIPPRPQMPLTDVGRPNAQLTMSSAWMFCSVMMSPARSRWRIQFLSRPSGVSSASDCRGMRSAS